MNQNELEQQLLEYVRRPGYQPVKPRVIAKQLGIPADNMVEVRRILKKLVRAGTLYYGSNHAVGLPAATPAKEFRGRLQKTASGIGFVRLVEDAPFRDRERDIFIPAAKCKDALDGDLVAISISRQRRGPVLRRVGEVVHVLERRTYQFVGTYSEENGQGFVRLDGGIIADPIHVGDPGAKNVRIHDKVVVEMVRFPTSYRPGEAVLLEVLGARSKPGVDTEMVMYEFALPREFPEAVLAEARDAASHWEESIPQDRDDFTQTPVITIDPASARDFDDAISLVIAPNGNWILGVHIADVSHFVPCGGPIDREARERATSVYLPDRVIPMLPEVISNNLASLQPQRIRLTQTALMEFTPDGERISASISRSVIRSCRRFTYEEIDDYLADPEKWRKQLPDAVWQLVHRMHLLAMKIRERRMARGSIELIMPEINLELDDRGQVKDAKLAENTVSHQIIEEFMLAANEAVAETLLQRRIPFLHRSHPEPNPKKLHDLVLFLKHLGFDVPTQIDRFDLKRVLAEVAGTPLEKLVNLTVLKSMQKAIYTPESVGHYALASDAYCHFTSPIRRYPDLVVHRALNGELHAPNQHHGMSNLHVLGEHCSEREQRAERAERELTRLKLLRYFAKRVGETFPAIITGVESFGIFAQCLPIPGEGRIARDSLLDDHFEYHRPSMTLVGRRTGKVFRVGDQIEVLVARIDELQRVIDLSYVRHIASTAPRHSSSRRKEVAKRGKPDHAPKRAKSKKTKRDQTKNPSTPKKKKAGRKKGNS
jgi:ribonuclease R